MAMFCGFSQKSNFYSVCVFFAPDGAGGCRGGTFENECVRLGTGEAFAPVTAAAAAESNTSESGFALFESDGEITQRREIALCRVDGGGEDGRQGAFPPAGGVLGLGFFQGETENNIKSINIKVSYGGKPVDCGGFSAARCFSGLHAPLCFAFAFNSDGAGELSFVPIADPEAEGVKITDGVFRAVLFTRR